MYKVRVQRTYLSVTSEKAPCRSLHLTKSTELMNGTEDNSSTVRVTLNLYFFFFIIKVIFKEKYHLCASIRLLHSARCDTILWCTHTRLPAPNAGKVQPQMPFFGSFFGAMRPHTVQI